MIAVPGLLKLKAITGITMALVFGVISGIFAIVLWYVGASGYSGLIMALFFSVIMLAIQWYLGPVLIKTLTRMKEIKVGDNPEVHILVEKLSKVAGIPKPKLYIVNDPTPNAFAFGRTQKSSNIAVHTGLLSLLDKGEIESVLAHEIGHIKHRDVLVMTVASVLPIMLYYIVLTMGMSRDSRERGGNIILIFIGAQIASFLGQLLVLWLSRQREYYADAFSAYITKEPTNLMSGLAKISYKMPVHVENTALKAFYIADPSISERQSIIEITKAIGTGNEKDIQRAIEREKKRGAVEVFMTHPLTAKRLDALLKLKRELV